MNIKANPQFECLPTCLCVCMYFACVCSFGCVSCSPTHSPLSLLPSLLFPLEGSWPLTAAVRQTCRNTLQFQQLWQTQFAHVPRESATRSLMRKRGWWMSWTGRVWGSAAAGLLHLEQRDLEPAFAAAHSFACPGQSLWRPLVQCAFPSCAATSGMCVGGKRGEGGRAKKKSLN